MYSKGIVDYNTDVKPLLRQAIRPYQGDIAFSHESLPQPFTLLHFSDIHLEQGTKHNLTRLVQFKKYISDMIDDTICTGDMVATDYNDGMTTWSEVSGSDNILMAIGNHDCWADTNHMDWTILATQTDQYNQYFAPYISNWGCTYTSGKTYYYKDYIAKKIRLIVINCMLTGSDKTDQLDWLATILTGAKTNEYTVVIATHYMPINAQKVACNYTALDLSTGINFLDEDYLSTVKTFIDGGGLFACYIAGHRHTDMIVHGSGNYSNQYCVVVDAANRWQSDAYSDNARVAGDKTQDLANLFVVDTSSKLIKIIRVGCDMNRYMRSKKYLCFSYDTGEIMGQG